VALEHAYSIHFAGHDKHRYEKLRGVAAMVALRGSGATLGRAKKVEVFMAALRGLVVPAGDGQHLKESSGQITTMKLFGRETGQSVTLFEQAVPAGSKSSWLHLHRHSDEVAYVLEGEFTFKVGDDVMTGGPGACAFIPRNVPHAWKNSGSQPGRVVFLFTPASAGRFIEEMIGQPKEGELKKRLEESGWEVLGPSPL
jgi:quercetin dioxygenase-like cupin family protein